MSMTTSWQRPSIIAVCGVLILALTAPHCLAGEPPAAQVQEDRIPRLGDHRFTPNPLAGLPFIDTYVRNSVGIGKAVDLYVPLLEIDGEPVVGLQGDLMNAILEFEFQQAIKDWVAFRAQIRVLGRLGTETQSLLSQGVTANMGFEFGWMFKLHQGDKTALSGTLNVWNNSITGVDLLGFVNGVVEGTNAPLVRKVPVVRGGGGLRYAWAVSELVGLDFLGETGMGESADRSQEDEWFFKFAAAIDFDLRSKTDLPFGIALAYYIDTFPEGGTEIADTISNTALRLAYTGTTDFQISLDFSYGWYQPKGSSEPVKLTSTIINLLYYF